MTMTKVLPLIVALVSLTTGLRGQAYYVDAINGNDTLDGRSELTAWQTLTNVNATAFSPGDTILFKAGCTWIGQLHPKGSGSAEHPIVASMYGGTIKPLFNGNGMIGKGVLYLHDQEYWEISNLEITNDALTEGDRRGVYVTASNYGIVHHIYLRNLDIHNIKGIVGGDDVAKRTAGIGIETTNDDQIPTRYDDIVIEGCTIYSVENTGLYTDNVVTRTDYPESPEWKKRCFTNVRVRNNIIHHIAKNAMIVRLLDKGVIEHNVCYETALQTTGNTMFTVSCDSTLFQYNEGYLNRSPGADGSMYDADLRSPNTIWQYSYSHDNSHGLIWFCTVTEDTGVIVRYNVSQNDKGRLVAFRYDFSGAYVYNNVFYVGSQQSPEIIHERSGASQRYWYYNNIVYNNSTTARYTWGSANRTIDCNLFFGNHPAGEPADLHKLTSDPMFVNPGTGTLGIGTLEGYKLQPGSPAIDCGFLLHNHSTADFWGGAVPSGAQPDRGVFEVQEVTSVESSDDNGKPSGVGLSRNYPNPFNSTTMITFFLPQRESVTVTVHDVLGRHIVTLLDGQLEMGSHSVKFCGDNYSSGVYYYTIRAGELVETKALHLVR